MTSKIINTPRILVLFISLVLTLVPAVSAGYVYPDNPDFNNNHNVRYIVGPVGEISSDTDNTHVYSETTFKLSKGETKSHLSPKLGKQIHWLEVDLRWKVPSNPLVLKIYSPSGTFLGTFHDNSEGKIDARIHLSIYPSEGYIEEGTWRFVINGESASETQTYTFSLYGH